MKEKSNNSSFSFKMEEGFDFVLQEGQNTSTNLRKIAWGDSSEAKIDIRKWSYTNGEERALKGVTLSDDGASELANLRMLRKNQMQLLKLFSYLYQYNYHQIH